MNGNRHGAIGLWNPLALHTPQFGEARRQLVHSSSAGGGGPSSCSPCAISRVQSLGATLDLQSQCEINGLLVDPVLLA